jgi:hypothetical protein
MNMRTLGGAALLGVTALLATSAPALAGDRHDGGRRGYYSSRGSYSHGRSYGRSYGRSDRSYRYGYRAPRYHYRSVRPYYYARPYYDDYAYDPYYGAYDSYYGDPRAYGPRYCPPRRRARVGVFFGF